MEGCGVLLTGQSEVARTDTFDECGSSSIAVVELVPQVLLPVHRGLGIRGYGLRFLERDTEQTADRKVHRPHLCTLWCVLGVSFSQSTRADKCKDGLLSLD